MQSSRLLHSNEEYAEFQPSFGIRLMGSHARMDRTRRPYTFARASPETTGALRLRTSYAILKWSER